jgi:hypothetical protein
VILPESRPSSPASYLPQPPEWFEPYQAGWQAAQSLMRHRLVRIVERLAELEPVMTGEARNVADELRMSILLMIAR